MGIYYDPNQLKWVVENEKTNYKTDYITNYQTDRKTDYKTNYVTNLPTNLQPLALQQQSPTLKTNPTYTVKIELKPNGGRKVVEVNTNGFSWVNLNFKNTDNLATVKNKLRSIGLSNSAINAHANNILNIAKEVGSRTMGFKITQNQSYISTNGKTTQQHTPVVNLLKIDSTGPREMGKSDGSGFFNVNIPVELAGNPDAIVQEIRNQLGFQPGDSGIKPSGVHETISKDLYNVINNVNTARKIGIDNFKTEEYNVTVPFLNEENATKNAANFELNTGNATLNQENAKLNAESIKQNKENTEKNKENTYFNTTNTAKNELYGKTLKIVSSTLGGDYVAQRDKITAQELINAGMPAEEANELVANIKDQFKSFYQIEKLQKWDPALGAKPPYGEFDPKYYGLENPVVAKAYADAVAIDDIDITERYGEAGYYLQHYTNIGKNQGLRGNEEEDTVAANLYRENQLTDKDIQDIRDYQLGIDKESITERLLNIPEVSNEWTKARNGDPYWSQLAKEKYLDPNDPDQFAVLFRLSERPEDKQIMIVSNAAGGQGITQMEEAINQAIGAKAEVDVKKFAALNQTILKDTVEQLKRVRAEQEMLSFYKGFSGFTEVVDLNKTLSDSILGDSGVGGILSFTSAGKAEESLLGALQNVTGMRNIVSYNWQQWFDEQIKNKYGLDYAVFEPLEEKKDILKAFTELGDGSNVFDSQTEQFSQDFLDKAGFTNTENLVSFLEGQGEEGLNILSTIKGVSGEEARTVLMPILSKIEADIKLLDQEKDRSLALAYTADDVTQMMNVEAQFARDYIDEYLLPRFNTSRSMNEFVEYLDVRQEEQNPFQTQDTYDALASLSELYTKEYLDNIRMEDARSFDPDFYFNPTGDAARVEDYLKQKETVEEDWEKAKGGDEYWNTQAYRFGIDVNNKAAFARMHFEVKGQGQGFDAADDITNASKIQDYLYNTVLPVLKEETFKQDPVFGQFITPEEFADEMLRGLDPDNTPDEWKEILQRYGLQDFAGTVDELRTYIIEALRTGSAQQIREQIKYLNEKRQRPTQEILGVTYIQRPEDYKDTMAKPTTELYAVFQKAGYQGTEDEFYENFFPDLDRSEQITLTKAGRDESLQAYGLDLKDPFASLGTIESFFPEYQAEAEKEAAKESPAELYTNYFKVGLDDDEEDVEYKSDTGKKFLDEFTSMFKGL